MKKAQANMENIQRLFLRFLDPGIAIDDYKGMEQALDSVEAEFRSVAYEALSAFIAKEVIITNTRVDPWIHFMTKLAKKHGGHAAIGMGWAIAETRTNPDEYLNRNLPASPELILDGIGYFNGLYHARKSLINRQIPEEISADFLSGFDQGLGRRLYYMANAEPENVKERIDPFGPERKPSMWRGIGIACGYVGGQSENNLRELKRIAGNFLHDFSAGIAIAGVSRFLSSTITPDIAISTRIICEMKIENLVENILSKKFELPEYLTYIADGWFTD